MQKTAQKRSILNKLREMSNVSGIAAEKFFNPEFERVMNSLRTADNKLRSIATGKSIEGEDEGDDPLSLKELLKNAKSNLNRREYMTAIAFLGRFHKKIHDLVKIIDTLSFDVDKVHHDFLFKDLDEDQKKHLQNMKSRFATSSSNKQLVAEAGIMDFLANISTERGRALSAWEKRYPKQVGKLKKEANNLFNKSEALLTTTLSAMKDMASFRATRKIDDYMKAAEKISSSYKGYDKVFRDFYNSNVKGFLEKQELVAPVKPVENEEEIENVEVEVPKVEEIPDLEEDNVPIPLVSEPAPATIPAPAPQAEKSPEEIYEDIQSPGDLGSPKVPQVEEEQVKSSHSNLINSLQAMSGESPIVLSNYIKRYALSIKDTNYELSIKLMKLAKSIKG